MPLLMSLSLNLSEKKWLVRKNSVPLHVLREDKPRIINVMPLSPKHYLKIVATLWCFLTFWLSTYLTSDQDEYITESGGEYIVWIPCGCQEKYIQKEWLWLYILDSPSQFMHLFWHYFRIIVVSVHSYLWLYGYQIK